MDYVTHHDYLKLTNIIMYINNLLLGSILLCGYPSVYLLLDIWVVFHFRLLHKATVNTLYKPLNALVKTPARVTGS